MRHFRTPDLSLVHKADGSPVTEADREIERSVEGLLLESAPGLGILGEEYGERPGTGTARLIIDPIDATLNFIRGDPVFATLLAIEVNREIVAGMVTAPALRQRWWATRGSGAYRDGKPIRVSEHSTLRESRIFHGTPTTSRALARYPGITKLLHDVRSESEVGDFLQHVRVAEGAGEAAVDLDVEPWDIAALKIIVEEAGGIATAADGSKRLDGGTLVSTNGRIHSTVLSYLQRSSADMVTSPHSPHRHEEVPLDHAFQGTAY